MIQAVRDSFEVLADDSSASDGSCSLDAVLDRVTACEAFVGIVAWRLGFVPGANNSAGKSIVQLAYDHARRLGKPCFMFLLDEKTPWPVALIDRGEPGERLAQFRKRVAEESTVSFFTTADELARQVLQSLVAWTRQTAVGETTVPDGSGRHGSRLNEDQAKGPE